MPKRAFNKTLLQIYLAFVLVSAAMLIPAYFVFRNTMLDVFRQMDNNNKLVIRGISQTFDNCSKEANKILNNIKGLPFDAYDPAQPKNIDWSNAYLFESLIDNMINTIDYIEDVIVLYYGSDTVITSKGTFNAKELFESKYRNGKYAVEFWKNFAAIRHPQKYIPLDTYTERTVSGTQIRRELLFIVGSNRLDSFETSVLVLVDVNKLLRFIDSQNLASGTSFVILDQENNMIANFGSRIDENDLQELYFDPDNENLYNKGGFEYYYVKSDYNNLVYLYKVLSKSRNIFTVVESSRILIISALLIGIIFLPLFLSLCLYRPVRRLLELLGNRDGAGVRDKYRQIYNGIEKIRSENETYRNYLAMADNEIRASLFHKISGNFPYDHEIRKQAERYFKGVFSYGCFVMASFLLEPVSSSDNDNGLPEDMRTSFEAFSTRIRSMLYGKTEEPVLLQINANELIVMIGLTQGKAREAILQRIKEDFTSLTKNITRDDSLTVVVSSLYSGMNECRHAFREIRRCQAYRNILPREAIIDASNPEFTHEWYFPADVLDKLTNCLNSGNKAESLNIINQMIKENLELNTNRIKLINIIRIISNVLIKIIYCNDYDREEIAKLEQDCFEKISDTGNFEEMREFLCRLVEMAVPRMQSGNIQTLDKKSVVEYINLHYTEELYLDKMAELFNTTPKYFSYLFKKTLNVNFIEYLNSVRILKAKDYLASTSLSVNEISEKVGYLNTGTFINAFKRCCGVLPTEYRKVYTETKRNNKIKNES